MQSFLKPQKNLNYVTAWQEILKQIDVIIVLTEWIEYKKIAKNPLIQLMDKKIIFDARRLFNAKEFPRSKYLTIGRAINST